MKKHDLLSRRILMSLVGVIVCGMGVGMFKYAAFGVDPFQSFMAGLSCAVPISFGLLYIIANLILLLFSVIFDRSKIGLATIINLTLLGYVVDWSHRALLAMNGLPSMGLRIAVMVVGLGVLGISCSFYITADLGVSTYDAVALVFHQKWPRIPFRYFRIGTDLVCVSLGVVLFLLSGQGMDRIGQVTGAGTILCACCLGPLIEYCNHHISLPLLHAHRR